MSSGKHLILDQPLIHYNENIKPIPIPSLPLSPFPLPPTRKSHILTTTGTRQAFLPGSSTRTGVPGHHTPHQAGKFKIDDDKVRVFIPPPRELYHDESVQSQLSPYVSMQINPEAINERLPPMPPLIPSFVTLNKVRSFLKSDLPKGPITRENFSSVYQSLSVQDKEIVKAEARRSWWKAYQRNIPLVQRAKQEGDFNTTAE